MPLLETSRTFFDSWLTAPELVPVAGGQAAVYSRGCPGVDGPNEDSAGVVHLGPGRGVLMVADGMGGERAGEVASRTAIACLVESVAGTASGESLRGPIINGIEAANEAVRALGVGAATTLVVAVIEEGTVRPLHVGDSKIIVFGGQGKLKLETVSHAPIARVHQAGLLTETAAMRHDDRNLVSNVLGEADMRIEIGSPLALSPRDTVLLASDGLFDNLRLREITERFRRGALQEGVARTVASVEHRMAGDSEEQPSKPDDLTLVAFRLD